MLQQTIYDHRRLQLYTQPIHSTSDSTRLSQQTDYRQFLPLVALPHSQTNDKQKTTHQKRKTYCLLPLQIQQTCMHRQNCTTHSTQVPQHPHSKTHKSLPQHHKTTHHAANK